MEKEDLLKLPVKIQADFYSVIEKILQSDPLTGGTLFNTHALKGKLKGYRALEIEYANVIYRLVYRIYDKPVPKRVEIISIKEHDPAYDRAFERLNR